MSKEPGDRPRKTRGPSASDLHRSIDEHLGARIRTLRNQHAWSQTKLGQLLGVTFQQVQKYEKGQNRISAALLHEVGKVFGLGIGGFFENLPGEADESPAGLAEAQAPLRPAADNGPGQEEIAALVRTYSRVSDPVVRNHVVALLRTLAGDNA